MKNFFTPTNDFVFKYIFGDERRIDILADFLQAVLDLPPEEYASIAIVDPQTKRESDDDKLGILDVEVRTTTGKAIDVEMQIDALPFMHERVVFYLSKMVVGQIAAGDEYDSIHRTISIVIANYTFIGDSAAYHNRYRLYDPETKSLFSDILEVDTLELPKLQPQLLDTPLGQWAQFFTTQTKEDFMQLATQSRPMIHKAIGVLMELNEDERQRMIADSREKLRRDNASRLKSAFAQGELRGIKTAARNLKAMHLTDAQIATATGLSLQEIALL